MDLKIWPLGPERCADYFDFFENRAFTDDSPYRCYCQTFQMSDAQFHAEYDGVAPENLGAAARESARQQIMSGALRGYLAYDGGKAIGWCNVNDRSAYPADGPVSAHVFAPAEKREKAVVCFEIAPEYRGRGVATALLNRALEDAQKEGCRAVEAYPVSRTERFEWDFNGPVRLYEKAGFVKASETKDYVVMRREMNK